MSNTKVEAGAATSNEDVVNLISELSEEDKLKLTYQSLVSTNLEDIRRQAVWWSYELEKMGAINDYERGTSNITEMIGLLKLVSTLILQVFEKQTRHEMQAQDKDSQWGMQLSDSINDVTTDIHSSIEDLTRLFSHYQTVLQGRRLGILFQDEDGTGVRRENT